MDSTVTSLARSEFVPMSVTSSNPFVEEEKEPVGKSTVGAMGGAGVEESAIIDDPEDLKPSSAVSEPALPFDYIVPVKTSFRQSDPTSRLRETVEFAAAVYSVKEGKVVATFQRFVHPAEYPKLLPREIAKLHIQQEQIDSAKSLAEVLDEFDAFLDSQAYPHLVTRIEGEGEAVRADVHTALPHRQASPPRGPAQGHQAA